MMAKDFDPNQAQVYVAPSNSGRRRYAPLNASGIELFQALTTGRKPKASIFTCSDGESRGKNHQQRPLLDACKPAKIAPPVRFHEHATPMRAPSPSPAPRQRDVPRCTPTAPDVLDRYDWRQHCRSLFRTPTAT
jgi:hypothetical protein